MAKYLCNPVNINYHYQFNKDPRNGGKLSIGREAADPSMICYQGRYYIFASMNLSVWVSDDLANWESYPLPEELPLYDYAPDVRVIRVPEKDENGDYTHTGEWVYFCASRRGGKCDRFRTKDILNGPYEKIEGTFDYWDPNLFQDDDGRIYFYWGCSNQTPIYGVELDPFTMKPYGATLSNPKGYVKELIFDDPYTKGFERFGEDHDKLPATEEQMERSMQAFAKKMKMPAGLLPESLKAVVKGMFADRPYIEGAWMSKHDGKYYLQYAFPGTQFKTYGDAVYVSDNPLGPFELAENAPYSYMPGGFFTGAGHGSTMEDVNGNLWHTASTRISRNFDFERRVGIWPAGYSEDGDLVCDQRYGDWPMAVPEGGPAKASSDELLWKDPEWMLLSYGKEMTASSFVQGNEPCFAADEDVRTWWRAASNTRDEWLKMDLGDVYDVRAIQINFADDVIDIPVPGKVRGGVQPRFIDDKTYPTQWYLMGSVDGETWTMIEDKSIATTDLSHDLIVREKGIQVRYLRITNMRVPYDQNPAISGLRVFGLQLSDRYVKPEAPAFELERTGDCDIQVKLASLETPEESRPLGYNILFGNAEDKLYHSYMVMADQMRQADGIWSIRALVKGRPVAVRVDTFNEAGITHGNVCSLQ
ncbi:MAG: family 43 glycosylhydrolase [Firmicutes bacterium]|nr:family 43 glycosylhydrolase [Bacillota bacterium]